MIVSEEINTIANALKRLVETHGAPNSFGCSEVADAAGYDINASTSSPRRPGSRAGSRYGRRFVVESDPSRPKVSKTPCLCGSTDYEMVIGDDGLERTSCCLYH